MEGFMALILVLGLLVPLVLYALIRDETASTRVVSRDRAEREAREFGGVDGRRERRDRSGDESAGRRGDRFDDETRRR